MGEVGVQFPAGAREAVRKNGPVQLTVLGVFPSGR